MLSANVTSRSSGRNSELRTRVEPRANRFNGFFKTSAVPLGPTHSLAEGETGTGDGVRGWGGGMGVVIEQPDA